MSRYLTPAKISLLCLTTIYCDGAVPNECIVPVLSFLTSHILQINPSSDIEAPYSSEADASVTAGGFEAALAHLPSCRPNRTILDILIVRLWNYISGIDSLFDFFTTLDRMLITAAGSRLRASHSDYDWTLQRPKTGGQRTIRISASACIIKLSKTSVLGIFIRRAKIEFARLQFQSVIKVLRAFQNFREGTRTTYLKLNPRAVLAHEDSGLGDLNDKSGGELLNAAFPVLDEPNHLWNEAIDETQVLLEFQVEKMQAYGCRLPIGMKKHLYDSLRTSTSVSNRSFYLRFLEAWYAGDYYSSFEYLHRSYDYGLQQRDRSDYQYALLNTAILQADFSCHGEAATAMQEAICTARENKDMDCLHFSLNWLYHFRKLHGAETKQSGSSSLLGSDKEALAFLVEKAKSSASGDTPMYNVWTSALQSQAQLCMSKGENIRDAFEKLYQSSHINLHFNVPTALGSQLLLQSHLYAKLGMIDLASQYCEIILICYADQIPAEEIVSAICRISQALTQLGLYRDAEIRLNTVPTELLRTLKIQRNLQTYRRLLSIRRLLLRNNLDLVEVNLTSLKASPCDDQDVKFEATVLEIELQIRRSFYSEAFKLVDELAKVHDDQAVDVHRMIRILTMKAIIFIKCGRPEKAFSIAIRAATAAWQAEIIPALWSTLATLVDILLSLSELEGAEEILLAALPQVDDVCDPSLTANYWSLKANLDMAKAGTEAVGSKAEELHLRATLISILKAKLCYDRLEDLQGLQEVEAKSLIVYSLLSEKSGPPAG